MEFWAYALRDLRTNTTRGFLAEFLVARAALKPLYVVSVGVSKPWTVPDPDRRAYHPTDE